MGANFILVIFQLAVMGVSISKLEKCMLSETGDPAAVLKRLHKRLGITDRCSCIDWAAMIQSFASKVLPRKGLQG
jgi:hypothetical protein